MNNGDMPAMPLESGNIIWNFEHGWERIGDSGLTKRETFAMAAMQGFIAAGVNGMPSPDEVALLSENYADALLKALEAKA